MTTGGETSGETSIEKLLIVGSLPPTQSHAALLTHSIATAAANCDIEVVCLIDALAPPPEDELPYQVVRPFDAFIQRGNADNWPRLFVVGGGGDSLPVIESLNKAPGAVITATNSLFDLTLHWLQTTPDYSGNLAVWLTDKYGKPGMVIADACINHRRTSDHLGEEIPAFDLLLEKATSHLALGPLQADRMIDAGCEPIEIGSTPAEPQQTDHPASNSLFRVLVIGADTKTIKSVSQSTATSALSQQLRLRFLNRYSKECREAILSSDAVAILDAHDSAECPHFNLAVNNCVPLITAGQRWTDIIPANGHIRLDRPVHAAALLHAIAAVAIVDGLSTGLAKALSPSGTSEQKRRTWATALLDASATAVPASLTKVYPMVPLVEPVLHMEPSPLDAIQPRGIYALIGAVPPPHILEHFYPELDVDACPRFMTPKVAVAAASFMQIPASRLQDRMGYEAPLIATEQTAPKADTGGRKLRQWVDVQQGLRRANNALVFGCTVVGATQASRPEGTVTWPLITVPDIGNDPAITSAFDTGSGIYWSYDPVRGALKFILLTGGAGQLEFQTTSDESFVITNISSTQIVNRQTNQSFAVTDEGLGMFKVALLPSDKNSDNDMLKSLAQNSLHLKWSFL